MWFRKNAIEQNMNMSPISQTIENIKSDATIWNEYFFYFLSRIEFVRREDIHKCAELADLMLIEYEARNRNV